MIRKMEVLSRPVDAPRGIPRVISDSSMTMRFALPASFLQTNAALSSTSIRKDNKSVKNDVEDSWETHDWEIEANSCVKNVKNVETEQEKDDWDHEPTLELPDDFPRLLVNLTRVRRQHFPDINEVEVFDVMEVFHRVKNTLHEHFLQLAEVFFEQKLCFHCTYGTSRAMMDGLHAAYPDDIFAMVDYPTDIDGVPLHEYLHTLSYPSKWKSVEYLKNCLRRCSRDIRWKRDVITELEVLAEQEFKHYEENQQGLCDEIDDLTRLRDSFREKLEKMTSQEGKPTGQYLLLRKLEDIENRLMILLDTYLTEPELEEEECYSAFGNPGGENGVTTNMNVLDMVIAMVFSRLPRDFSQQATTEDHFQMLFDHHIHILRLWKKDFGRLPLKSRIPPQNASGSDEDSVCVSSGEERATYDIVDEEDKVEDDVRDCWANDDAIGRLDEVTHTVVDKDSWHVQDDSDRGCDESIHRKIHHDNDSDGYGADFDSDESEDEGEKVTQMQAQRHQQKLGTCKPGNGETLCTAVGLRQRRMKHTKRSKKLHKLKVETDESDDEGASTPFEPFACTGAVGLLRLAKENELF
ncbi:hypothetical protein KXD40_004541 [Peronospora effusa]|uniref:Uncharacterized protein n=1 Tax=Peronospora effusa TaxID=542832 RepID=A0A3R7XGV7_9STRA|nr:hypothetical protein DD237_007157 [Peronospora effusa]UIZ28401.1 hypothetical protein KXD40_004541 [Peronospora effusa]CAI5722097.1 unnamed protein product [Peronospora effusa]